MHLLRSSDEKVYSGHLVQIPCTVFPLNVPIGHILQVYPWEYFQGVNLLGLCPNVVIHPFGQTNFGQLGHPVSFREEVSKNNAGRPLCEAIFLKVAIVPVDLIFCMKSFLKLVHVLGGGI